MAISVKELILLINLFLRPHSLLYTFVNTRREQNQEAIPKSNEFHELMSYLGNALGGIQVAEEVNFQQQKLVGVFISLSPLVTFKYVFREDSG